MRCGTRPAQRTIQRVCPLVKGWKIMLDEWTLHNPRVHQTLPTKAPSSASTGLRQFSIFLKSKPTLLTLGHVHWMVRNFKKNRSKRDAASVMRERVHCQGIFGTRDLQIIGHGGPDLIWRQVNQGLMSQTQANFGSKVQHLSSNMADPCTRDSELETSSNAVRHVGNSRNRPCGHLCFYFEETFNLQIQCQQTPTVVVACKTFSLLESLCNKAGAPLKLKDQIEESFCDTSATLVKVKWPPTRGLKGHLASPGIFQSYLCLLPGLTSCRLCSSESEPRKPKSGRPCILRNNSLLCYFSVPALATSAAGLSSLTACPGASQKDWSRNLSLASIVSANIEHWQTEYVCCIRLI